MKITADKVIDVYHDAKPRYLWKLYRDSYCNVRTLQDADGKYLWTPDLEYEGKPGYLLGIEIGLVDTPSFKLVLIHSENVELICRKGI